MRTGLIDTWVGNPADVGPMYPFVGYEVPLFVVCLGLWIAYTFWQIRHERANYRDELDHLVEASHLATAIEGEGKNF